MNGGKIGGEQHLFDNDQITCEAGIFKLKKVVTLVDPKLLDGPEYW
jgi:hypothetical protein